jgi:hypothetical protein
VSELDGDRNPTWRTEVVFLKVLVEGKASLYEYEDYRLHNFFYSVDSSSIETLVFKRFLRNAGGVRQVGTNQTYLQQLKNHVFCNTTMEKLIRVKYHREDLKKYFWDFNACNGEVIAAKRSKKRRVYFYLAPGMDVAKGKIVSTYYMNSTKYSPTKQFRIGIMTEFVLPFNKNKWSILLEPAYQYFNHSNAIDYKSIEFSYGVRYYIFLKNDTKLFVNALALMDFPLQSAQFQVRGHTFDDPKSASAITDINFGLGIARKNLSIEARWYSTRKIQIEAFTRFEYSKSSLIVSYKF